MGGIGGRVGIKIASASTSSVNEPQGPHFNPHSKAKANFKSINLRKLVTDGLSVVVFTSVHSEKTCPKKLMNMII